MPKRKKLKQDRPPLLAFLLREFREKPSFPDHERQTSGAVSLDGDSGPAERNFTSLLLSCLTLDFLRHHDPVPPPANVKKETGPEEEDDDDLNDESDAETDLMKGRFDVLPSNPIGEDYLKRAGSAVKNPNARTASSEKAAGEVRYNADNYRQLYLSERDRQAEVTPEKTKQREEAQRKENETAAKLAEEARQVDASRFRARELQSQIAWWKQQSGIGTYDDSTISYNIELLQRELNLIPVAYW